MFSFHKPKIYRSIHGCCICKAKSSSSRFTDSKKYEPEFEKCFKIIEHRSGEICNACVLLVKRWKKLPSNTTRNWHHVVDARAGPGTKSVKPKLNYNTNDNSLRSTTTPLDQLDNSSNNRKPHVNCHHKQNTTNNSNKGLRRRNPIRDQTSSPEGSDSSDTDDDMEEDIDDIDEEMEVRSITKKEITECSKRSLIGRTTGRSTKATANINRKTECDSPTNTAITSFLDMSFWKKEKICCGIIFKGPDNEVLIYPKLLEPCYCRRRKSNLLKPKLSSIGNSGSSDADTGSVGSSSLIDAEDANSNSSSGNISLI
ncbi:SIN3-HDAC complex-associated factor-like [Oppia nitens]|uniref:SIN3-HDAC complex-associated factor-like n=1 Tax=Oppia nitens TaxID=1686743 RepID=UPI0023D9919B|nr:SIN3-HDAC complex-associated factor-like [Oppia nitens]